MRKKTYLKLVEYQTEQSEKHLNEVRSIHKEMRGYKHDFHHHLQTLKGQLEAGEVDRALAYIEQLDNQLMNVDTLLKTGNVSLDAILSAKIAQAKAENIAVTVKANVPDALTISDLELSIIIGNLLDNAIEACRTVTGERFIRIFISMKGTMIYFSIVGMNGSGKTTFIKLLCRLYDPTEGEILLNGVNIQKYDYDEYMSVFSVVFQDFSLFSFKIGEVVASSKTFDENKVCECLQKANFFGDRLHEMPDGVHTYLYKGYDQSGIEISGGEAQKIALARALYKDSPFILLDEPTAALDPISEYEVYSNFNAISGDKTTVYISHRLASCRFCNKIVVFDDGKIVQHGSHEELLSDVNGKYHELWNAQAQYYTT